MKGVGRGFVLLSIAAVAFAGMILLVYTGVTALRRARDLRFGLEDLDLTLREDRLDEAEAMLPWLARRAPNAAGTLSVLRRSLVVAERSGKWDAFDTSAQIAVDRFPGNISIRRVAVYGAYQTGDYSRALDWAGHYLQSEEHANLYGLTLLGANESFDSRPPESSVDNEETIPHALRITNLRENSAPEEYLAVWQVTGDWRYAQDAAALLMAEGRSDAAGETVVNSSIPLYSPLFAYEVFTDRGEYGEALLALGRASESLSATDSSRTEMLQRTADALVRLGRFQEAEATYQTLAAADAGSAGARDDLAYVNLAWLADSYEEAETILTDAILDGVVSWNVLEQLALLKAEVDPDESAAIVAAAINEFGASTSQQLFALRMEANPDRRGYAAAIWALLNNDPGGNDSLELQRFALYYFFSRGMSEDLRLLLETTGSAHSWSSYYRGLQEADEGTWAEAANQFAIADANLPGWYTAYNAGIASLRAGKVAAGREFLNEAARRAELSAFPQQSEAVLLALARTSDDRGESLSLVDRAIRINPTNSSALRLRSLISP